MICLAARTGSVVMDRPLAGWSFAVGKPYHLSITKRKAEVADCYGGTEEMSMQVHVAELFNGFSLWDFRIYSMLIKNCCVHAVTHLPTKDWWLGLQTIDLSDANRQHWTNALASIRTRKPTGDMQKLKAAENLLAALWQHECNKLNRTTSA